MRCTKSTSSGWKTGGVQLVLGGAKEWRRDIRDEWWTGKRRPVSAISAACPAVRNGRKSR